MCEVRLVVRDIEQDWSGAVDAGSAQRVIASLAADPVTRAELESAFRRFEKRSKHSPLVSLSPGLCDEPCDGGLVVVDLVARLVAVDSTEVEAANSGAVEYHDNGSGTDVWLRYCLAADWLLVSDRQSWPKLAAERRQVRGKAGPLDAREVFYGRPLMEFIASRLPAARLERPAAQPADVVREVHAAWLLTPRDELRGRCPREVALEHRRHITTDLEHQAEHWSRLQSCPPGLDEGSAAYRFGGFGTHELVEYYELVRELLWSCQERLDTLASERAGSGGLESLEVDEFVSSEAVRLEQVREAWLDTPNSEFHGRMPRSIIHRERARLPEGVSAREAIVDPDCPCCQAMADLPGPMFWHLDGCSMDDDFAFDIYYLTPEEWEEEQRHWAEFNETWKAKNAERERLDDGFDGGDEEPVWRASYTAEDDSDLQIGVRLFGISAHLGELIGDLRRRGHGSTESLDIQAIIDRLNRDCGNLREVLQHAELSLATTLVEPVIDRFSQSLADVAARYPELASKCDALTDKVTQLWIGPRDG